MTPWGGACMDPRGMVSRIYKEDHYTLLSTKYESCGPCVFGEVDFFMFFPCRPRGGAHMGPRGTVGRIYKEDHYTLLHTNYTQNMKALALVVLEKKIFLCFSHCNSMGAIPYETGFWQYTGNKLAIHWQ